MKKIILSLVVLAFISVFPQAAKSDVPRIRDGNAVHFMKTLRKIHEARKSHVITDAQVKGFIEQVRQVRKEELAFFDANGSKDVTNAQRKQLNQELDAIEAQL